MNSPPKRALIWLVPWLIGLGALGALSLYSPFPPPGAHTDARISAMLTPSGILESVVFEHTPDHEINLRPYYDEPMKRGGLFELPFLALAYALVLASAIGFLRAWRPFR